jgi:hypothetical protein
MLAKIAFLRLNGHFFDFNTFFTHFSIQIFFTIPLFLQALAHVCVLKNSRK